MREDEVTRFHDVHKGDASVWDATPSDAIVKPTGLVTLSVRFTREELAAITEAAASREINVIEFVRAATITATEQKKLRSKKGAA